MSGHTLLELAEVCGATLEGDGERIVFGAAALRDAEQDQISFFGSERHRTEFEVTRAAAVICPPDLNVERERLAVLRCENPSRAFTAVCEFLAAERPQPASGIHSTAIVHPSARVGCDVSLGAYCVIEAQAELGDGVVCHPHVVVGAGSRVGAGTLLYAHVVLYDGVSIGERCIIHAATVVGSDGFGFEPTQTGWDKIPQLGSVQIADDVELGAGCTLDRGRFSATKIGRGTKLDNQVHVSHNSIIGQHVMLSAQVGMAGSARIEDWVMIGGQAGLSGHRTIGARARIAGGSGVMGDVPPGEEWLGYPARPMRGQLRRIALIGRLPSVLEDLKALQARVAELEASEGEAGEGEASQDEEPA